MRAASGLGGGIRRGAAGVIAAVLLGAGAASAADADAAIRDAEQAYRAAERSLFAGEHQAAAQKLQDAAALARQARDAGGSAGRLNALDTKIRQLGEKVAKRTGGPAPAAATAAGATPATASAALPSGVSFRLREADQLLQRGERALGDSSAHLARDWRVATARAAAGEGRDKLREIETRFPGQYRADHADIAAVAARAADLERRAGELEAAGRQADSNAMALRAAADAASGPWAARLAPYAIGLGQPEHDPRQWFVASATMDAAEMQRRLRVYGEVKQALGDLHAANLPARSGALDALATDLAARVTEFESSMKSYAVQLLQDANQQIDHADQFVKEQARKASARETVLLLQKDQLSRIRERLDAAAGLTAAGDPGLAAARARLAAIEKADGELRRQRVAETRMRPDAFGGRDAAAVRKQAEAVVRAAFPDAKVLRTTVPGADWKEESVIEYTDTTQSALRHRITRSVTAQVAATVGGETRLLTLDVSQDRQSAGGWGALKGHVMFNDAMLAENVGR